MKRILQPDTKLNDIEAMWEEHYFSDLILNTPKTNEQRIKDDKRHARNLVSLVPGLEVVENDRT
jgi:hypothetical protein